MRLRLKSNKREGDSGAQAKLLKIHAAVMQKWYWTIIGQAEKKLATVFVRNNKLK
jgi:hypothetical protein